jgi:hypothetical protein
MQAGEESRCGGRNWVTARTDTIVGMVGGKCKGRVTGSLGTESPLKRQRTGNMRIHGHQWSGASSTGLGKWDAAAVTGARALHPELGWQ